MQSLFVYRLYMYIVQTDVSPCLEKESQSESLRHLYQLGIAVFAEWGITSEQKRPTLEWLYRHLLVLVSVDSEAQHSCHNCGSVLQARGVLQVDWYTYQATRHIFDLHGTFFPSENSVNHPL